MRLLLLDLLFVDVDGDIDDVDDVDGAGMEGFEFCLGSALDEPAAGGEAVDDGDEPALAEAFDDGRLVEFSPETACCGRICVIKTAQAPMKATDNNPTIHPTFETFERDDSGAFRKPLTGLSAVCAFCAWYLCMGFVAGLTSVLGVVENALFKASFTSLMVW